MYTADDCPVLVTMQPPEGVRCPWRYCGSPKGANGLALFDSDMDVTPEFLTDEALDSMCDPAVRQQMLDILQGENLMAPAGVLYMSADMLEFFMQEHAAEWLVHVRRLARRSPARSQTVAR